MMETNSNILDKIMGSQTQNSLNEFQPTTLVNNLLALLKERDREIVAKRFGLAGSEMETLEGIGKKHSLTRERVRQIEKDSLNFLKKQNIPELDTAVQLIFDTVKEHGNIVSEEYLMQILQVGKTDFKERQSIKFLLSLSSQFKNLGDSSEYLEAWHIAGFDLSKLEQVLAEFEKILTTTGHVISQDELYQQFKETDFYKQHQMELTDRVLKSYLSVAKPIQINPYNEIGLKNDNKFDNRTAYQETVHNELIKDSRFVLIGRGIYALTEWGYKRGVVADVIKEILISFNRPLTRDEIINEVMKRRQVKRNTILVGLSNRKNFQKVGKDKYALANNVE